MKDLGQKSLILSIIVAVSLINTAQGMTKSRSQLQIDAEAGAITVALSINKHVKEIHEATLLPLPLAETIAELAGNATNHQDKHKVAAMQKCFILGHPNNPNSLYSLRCCPEQQWITERKRLIANFVTAESPVCYTGDLDFSNANFSGLNRSQCCGTVLAPSLWLYTNFSRANMPGHRFPIILLAHKTNCTETNFTGSTFGSEGHFTDLRKANFDKSILDDCTFINTALGWKNLLKAASIKGITYDKKSMDLLARDAQDRYRGKNQGNA